MDSLQASYRNPFPPRGESIPPLASRGLYLEAVADTIRFDSPTAIPAGNVAEDELHQILGALRAIDTIDALIATVISADDAAFATSLTQLESVTAESPTLEKLAERRLRRVVTSPWFESIQQMTPPRDVLCDRLRRVAESMAAAADDAPARPAAAGAPWPTALGMGASLDTVYGRLPAADRHTAAHGSSRAAARGPTLSPRELEVVRYVAEGLTNKEIAIRLELSPNTIKRHMARVLRRLGVAKRSAVATWYATRPRSENPLWQEP